MGEEKREKFLKVYANVPNNLREDIAVVVEDKTYTWNASFFEIKNRTPLSEKILKKLEAVKVI